MARTYDPAGQAVRFAKCEQALKEAGGRRINVRLQPKATKAVERAMLKNGESLAAAVNRLLVGVK